MLYDVTTQLDLARIAPHLVFGLHEHHRRCIMTRVLVRILVHDQSNAYNCRQVNSEPDEDDVKLMLTHHALIAQLSRWLLQTGRLMLKGSPDKYLKELLDKQSRVVEWAACRRVVCAQQRKQRKASKSFIRRNGL